MENLISLQKIIPFVNLDTPPRKLAQFFWLLLYYQCDHMHYDPLTVSCWALERLPLSTSACIHSRFPQAHNPGR